MKNATKIVCTVIALAVSACNQDEATETNKGSTDPWQRAVRVNTTEAYESYLGSNPDSDRASEARVAIDNLSWKAAQADDSEAAIRIYMNEHPEGQHSEAAAKRLEELVWASHCATNTVESYRDFYKAYPESDLIRVYEAEVGSYLRQSLGGGSSSPGIMVNKKEVTIEPKWANDLGLISITKIGSGDYVSIGTIKLTQATLVERRDSGQIVFVDFGDGLTAAEKRAGAKPEGE